jgi:dihydrofolate reductase
LADGAGDRARTAGVTGTMRTRSVSMPDVIFDMSMSLDGFVVAPDRTPAEPLGKGGLRLHDWAFASDDERDRPFAARQLGIGAVICGRRTYDDSLPWWKADGPVGQARVPTFVVTHGRPDGVPADGVYTFVTDGIHDAVRQAGAAAAGRDVSVLGADVARQLLRAQLVDEIVVHVVPVLFGGGLRMFDRLGEESVDLEAIEAVQTRLATHQRYRVVRRP